MNARVSSRANRRVYTNFRLASIVLIVSLSTVGIGHAASLGGLRSDELSSFTINGTVPPPATTTTTTTVPPAPTICGPGTPSTAPCVVPAGTTIKKLDWDGDVLVLGVVSKNLKIEGGSITVGAGGVVGGNVDQKGPGGVLVMAGGTVRGHVKEDGAGSVVIDGTVDRHVEEQDDGDLIIGPGGVALGDVREFGPGMLSIQGTVDRKAEEEGPGDLLVSGVVNSDASESGDGSVLVDGLVDGVVRERDDGDLTVADTATINNGLEATPGGICTISPTAAVFGPRIGDCA